MIVQVTCVLKGKQSLVNGLNTGVGLQYFLRYLVVVFDPKLGCAQFVLRVVVLPNALRMFSPTQFHHERLHLIQFKTTLQKSVINIPNREQPARQIGRQITHSASNVVSGLAVMYRIKLIYLRIDFV